MYIYIYIHVCIYKYIYVYLYIYIYMYINTCMYVTVSRFVFILLHVDQPRTPWTAGRQLSQLKPCTHQINQNKQANVRREDLRAAFRAHMQNATHTHAIRDQTHTSHTYARVSHQFC